MPFCTNCGQPLPTGAKFCSECGTPIGDLQTTNGTQHKKVYDGEIHKCPNCGEVLGSFIAVCPTCGYELRGAKVSESAREFSSKLAQADTDAQKISLIRSFPIPNTKEDILEFMVLASSNFDANYTETESSKKEVSDAWLVKFEQSYQKAKLLFENKVEYDQIQNVYQRTHQKIDGVKKKQDVLKRIGILSSFLGILSGLVLIVIGVLIPAFSRASMDSSRANTLIFFGGILLIITVVYYGKKGMDIKEAGIGVVGGIIPIIIGVLIPVFFHGSMDSSRANTLVFIGSIVLIITVVNYVKGTTKSKQYANTSKRTKSPTETKRVSGEMADEYRLIKVPSSAFSENNYLVVVSLFEQAGFTNIKTVPLHDLRKGFFRRDEERKNELVKTIHINGKSPTMFKRTYPANSDVVISYHSFQN